MQGQMMHAGAGDVGTDTWCTLFQPRSGQAISSQQILQSYQPLTMLLISQQGFPGTDETMSNLFGHKECHRTEHVMGNSEQNRHKQS